MSVAHYSNAHRLHNPMCIRGKCGMFALSVAYSYKLNGAVNKQSTVICHNITMSFDNERPCAECLIQTAERIRNECVSW